MIDEGYIDISVAPGAVGIASTRSKEIARLFVGRTPADVAPLVGAVFSICGAAQGMASALCLAGAGAESVPTKISWPVVAAEALRAHLMRIAVDWQTALSPERAPAEALRRIHKLPAVAAEDPAKAAGDAVELMELWIGRMEDIFSGPETLARLPTVAGRLFQLVLSRGWSGVGAAGIPPETERTVYRLVAAQPRMTDLIARHGDGLLARLYARLVHVALLVTELQSPAIAPEDCVCAGDWGEGHVVTSRGLLSHRARLERGRVAAYEITAPTDVNFTADGPAQMALLKLAGESQNDLATTARLMVDAFDPCVAYGLKVQ